MFNYFIIINFLFFGLNSIAIANIDNLFNSKSVLVVNKSKNEIVLEKNADDVLPIASLTKMMTNLIALENKKINGFVKITTEDIDRLKHSSSRLKVGTKLSTQDAFKISLLSSENRATSAIARKIALTHNGFVKMMNNKTKKLKLYNTSFADPTGLNPNNQSSAKDVERIMWELYKYNEARKIATLDKTYLQISKKKKLLYKNTNPMINKKGWKILLSKTGYTNEAGKCIAFIIENNGKLFSVVLLGAKNKSERESDMIKIKNYLNYIS